jgi:hypothetical protein
MPLGPGEQNRGEVVHNDVAQVVRDVERAGMLLAAVDSPPRPTRKGRNGAGTACTIGVKSSQRRSE